MKKTWLVFGLVGLSLWMGQGASAGLFDKNKEKTAKNKANAVNFCHQKVADGTYAECFADADRLCNLRSGFSNVAKFDEGGNSWWACCKSKSSGGGLIGAIGNAVGNVTGAASNAVGNVTGAASNAVGGVWNKKCKVNYVYGNYKSPDHDLGNVDGFNKKTECLAKAKNRVEFAQAALRAAVPNPAGVAGCGGLVDVYVDTTVEGKTFSRDGSMRVQFGKPPVVETKAPKVTCSRGWAEGSGCVDQVANAVNGGIPNALKWKFISGSDEVFVDDKGGVRMKFGGTKSCDNGFNLSKALGGAVCTKQVAGCSW